MFTVGGGGTILHYNGTSWTTQASGTLGGLVAVWGNSGTQVIVVGDQGTVLRGSP